MEEKGSAIVKRIDLLLKEGGLTRKALVYAGAIKSVQSVTDWGERNTVPRADVALAIADFLKVSVRWLITGEDEKGLSRNEQNLLAKFGCLTEDNQLNVQALIESMLAVPGEGKKAKKRA
jgi:hypothetical protein